MISHTWRGNNTDGNQDALVHKLDDIGLSEAAELICDLDEKLTKALEKLQVAEDLLNERD